LRPGSFEIAQLDFKNFNATDLCQVQTHTVVEIAVWPPQYTTTKENSFTPQYQQINKQQ